MRIKTHQESKKKKTWKKAKVSNLHADQFHFTFNKQSGQGHGWTEKCYTSRLHELAEVVGTISSSEMDESVWKAHLDLSAKDTLVQHAERFYKHQEIMGGGGNP